MRKFLFVLLSVVLFSSCKKDPIILPNPFNEALQGTWTLSRVFIDRSNGDFDLANATTFEEIIVFITSVRFSEEEFKERATPLSNDFTFIANENFIALTHTKGGANNDDPMMHLITLFNKRSYSLPYLLFGDMLLIAHKSSYRATPMTTQNCTYYNFYSKN